MTGQSIGVSFRSLALAAFVLALAVPASGSGADVPALPAVSPPSAPAAPDLPVTIPVPVNIPIGGGGGSTKPASDSGDGPATSSGHVNAASDATAAGSEQKGGAATAAGVAGAVRLPGGGVSVLAGSLSKTDRLVLDRLSFAPNVIRSRVPIVLSLRVKDSRGYLVRSAFVSITSMRKGWLQETGMWQTGLDGTVRVTLVPTKQLPLRSGKLGVVVRVATSTDASAIALQKIARIRVSNAQAH